MDLTERLGFRAELNLDTGEIDFPNLKPTLVLERRLSDMHRVFAEQIDTRDNPIVHRIYRAIGDTAEIEKAGLKFDLTVVLPHPFGMEFPKTTGHYHLPLQDAQGVPSPDFYQILHGKGLILLQRRDGQVMQAFEVNAQEMQHVLIPPWTGHLTINTGKEPLVFANVCVRAEHLDYRDYLERRGAAYYLVKGQNGPTFVRNLHYQTTTLDSLRPVGVPTLEGFDGKPFYPLLEEQTAKLEFLTRPDKHINLFESSLK